jgi:hypothetical protein
MIVGMGVGVSIRTWKLPSDSIILAIKCIPVYSVVSRNQNFIPFYQLIYPSNPMMFFGLTVTSGPGGVNGVAPQRALQFPSPCTATTCQVQNNPVRGSTLGELPPKSCSKLQLRLLPLVPPPIKRWFMNYLIRASYYNGRSRNCVPWKATAEWTRCEDAIPLISFYRSWFTLRSSNMAGKSPMEVYSWENHLQIWDIDHHL